jgi:hypothetical protein
MGQDDQVGKGQAAGEVTGREASETLRALDMRNERRILWAEVAILITLALLAAAYLVAWRLAHPRRPASVPPVSATISQFAMGSAVSAARYPFIHSAETAKPRL